MRTAAFQNRSQEGIALIMVLWVMVLLAAMATEFSYSMRVEVNSTRNFKEEMECAFLAESGIELAMAEILEIADFHALDEEGQLVFFSKEKEEEKEGKVVEKPKEPGEKLVLKAPNRTKIPLGAGTLSYWIVDENRKISINVAPKELLEKTLEEGGVSDNKLRDSISDAILDWIDENDLHRLNGVEKDYYEKLPDPYSCKNAAIDNIEEMLWIKDVKPEIIFGTDYVKSRLAWNTTEEEEKDSEKKNKMKGIYSLITVENTGNINLNTASERVLKILFPQEEAERILTQRLEKGYYDQSKSTYFTIYSLGEMADSGIKRLIVATVKLTPKDAKTGIMITYWNDNEDPEKYYDLLNQGT